MQCRISTVFFLVMWTALACVCSCCAQSTGRILLMVSEQNIDGPRSAWWASEVDLSATEAAMAQELIASGFEVIDPSLMHDTIRKDKAYRFIDVPEKTSVQIGAAAKVDYVVVGKAIASAAGTVPESTMRSCYANLTAKLIRVKDRKVIAYLDAAGSSAHPDVISGGREALVYAGRVAGAKLVEALSEPAAPPVAGK
jgi:hypothetical protein